VTPRDSWLAWLFLTPAIVLVAVPVVLVFVVLQRHLIAGLTGGAVKG
jgi:ABC-type maltose transport system permease subunit